MTKCIEKKEATLYLSEYSSPLGKITLATDGKSLTGLWFEGQKYFLNTICKNFEQDKNSKIINQTKLWLDRYFAGKNPSISELSLAPYGSEFRQKVWAELLKIPYGKTTTYGEIAKKITSKSAQAVGGAVGHNPISIIIPCHRVIGSDGNLTGYAGGIERKIQLLALEGVKIS